MTVVLRKAFGGAFIAMNSRELGADLVLAWPRAQLGVMGPKQAVDLVHRREIAAAEDPPRARDRFADRYAADHLTASSAAAEGVIDEIVAPSATRARLMAALRSLLEPRKASPAGKEHPAMTLTMTRRSHEDGPVLITGTTGFVGMELLVRVLDQTDRDVVALVRAADDDAAAARIDTLLRMILPPEQRPAARRRVLARCGRPRVARAGAERADARCAHRRASARSCTARRP